MSTVMDSNVVAASEPLVNMAEIKDVKLESPHGKEIDEAADIDGPNTSNDASNDGATNGDDKVAATVTDKAGAKSSSDEGAMDEDTSKTTPAAPKKRGAKSDGDGGPPKKKRASPKAKKAKEDENHEEDGEAGEADPPETPVKKTAARGKGGKGKNNKTNGSAEPITPPKTPKVKGSVKVGNDVTGAVMSDDDGNDKAEASITEGPAITKKGAARKRASAGKIGNTVPISTSLETASAEDKMLFKLKEEGKSWAVIRDAWETMTGEKTKNSTLPNRYVRLKSNFMTLKEGDGARLLAARAEVEAEIEAHVAKLRADTWSKVQKLMEDKGTTEKYPTPFLVKKHEELSAKPAISSDDEAKDDNKEDDSEDGKDVKMEDVASGEEGGEMVGAAAEGI